MSTKKSNSKENQRKTKDIRLQVLKYNDGECVLSPLPRRVALVAVAVAIVSQVLMASAHPAYGLGESLGLVGMVPMGIGHLLTTVSLGLLWACLLWGLCLSRDFMCLIMLSSLLSFAGYHLFVSWVYMGDLAQRFDGLLSIVYLVCSVLWALFGVLLALFYRGLLTFTGILLALAAVVSLASVLLPMGSTRIILSLVGKLLWCLVAISMNASLTTRKS